MEDKEGAMTTHVSRNAVIAFFQAYSSRDPVRIAPFIADDVEWMIVGPVDLLHFCGPRKGRRPSWICSSGSSPMCWT